MTPCVPDHPASIPAIPDPAEPGELMRHGPAPAETELYLHLVRAQALANHLYEAHAPCQCADCVHDEYFHFAHLLQRNMLDCLESNMGGFPEVDEDTGLPRNPAEALLLAPVPLDHTEDVPAEVELDRLLRRVLELLAAIHRRHQAGCADGCGCYELPHWQFLIGRLVVDLKSGLLETDDGQPADKCVTVTGKGVG